MNNDSLDFIPKLDKRKKARTNIIYDLIIVGAGPAGITASIYAARKRLNFIVLSKDIGGQVIITSTVENYTGYQEINGSELVKKFDEHLKEFNFDLKITEVKKITKENNTFLVKTETEIFNAKTLIITTGAKPRMLNIKGEIEFKNRGVTYCATCDAPLFTNKDVVVIGGGNSALDAVLQLINIAQKVYLLIRNDVIKGDKIMIDKVKANPKVEILLNTVITEILGDKMVKGIKIYQKGDDKEIAVQGIFIEVGYIPNTGFLRAFLKLNSVGEIEIDSSNNTNINGVFAAGDCTNIPFKQIIIAASEGAKAAISAFNYLAKIN